jgi:hypothetical protein
MVTAGSALLSFPAVERAASFRGSHLGAEVTVFGQQTVKGESYVAVTLGPKRVRPAETDCIK